MNWSQRRRIRRPCCLVCLSFARHLSFVRFVMRDRRWLALLAGLLLSWLAPLAAAEEPAIKAEKPKKDVYLRVVRDDKGEPLALQTSVVRYVPIGGDRA